jgi:hypothetical protein
VLPVAIPFLALQPLVENAVQHGVERTEGGGSVQVSGEAQGEDCVIAVEDDGPGMPPERAQDVLAGRGTGTRLGLVNVDRRLRAVFGAGYGLVIETAPGAGTRVVVRTAVPPRRRGVSDGGAGCALVVDDVRRPWTRCASCARGPGLGRSRRRGRPDGAAVDPDDGADACSDISMPGMEAGAGRAARPDD